MNRARAFTLVTVLVLLGSSARVPRAFAQGQVESSPVTAPGATFIYVPMTPEPPALTDAQKAQLEQRQMGRPLPHAFPLPDGTTGVQRPDSVPDPSTATPASPTSSLDAQASAEITALVPGTFTLFRNAYMGATIKGNTSGATGEPNVANAGAIVFTTGNWWAAISGNGGRTFSYISPYTMFPASFGGFCCDQKAVYDPSRDIFIWYLQYSSAIDPADSMGKNIYRLAAARPADALRGFWWYYDIKSAPNTEWDYPEMCLSNNYVYITTNRGAYNSNSVNDAFIYKWPLDSIAAAAASLSGSVLDLGGAGFSNLSLKCSRGAEEVMYFGSHNSTSQIRTFSWADNSGTIFNSSINLSAAWPNNARICPTPDGRNWCGFDDGRMMSGWIQSTRQGRLVGFMWDASGSGGGTNCNGTFASCPYVEAARVTVQDPTDPPTYTYFDRPFVWSGSTAFQYPAAAPNARGDLGIVLTFSNTSNEPTINVGIDDDYHRCCGWDLAFVRASSQGPNVNRWGDYFAVAPYLPYGLSWITIGQTLQGCGVAGCKESNFVIFGRARDSNGTPLFADANRDFNGDNKSDILWRNPSTGNVALWLMNGGTLLNSFGFGNMSPWVVVGVGDFNGDGSKADILWQNPVTGIVALWLMSGGTVLNSFGFGNMSPWVVAGVGDFNGDGKADILWQNTSTGNVALWFMDGGTVIGSTGFGNMSPWVVAGVGDFNADGKADILWRNTSTGNVAMWLMSGGSVLNSFGFGNMSPWVVDGIGDFNADGNADIVWRNTSTGNVALWLMNGGSVLNSFGFGSMSPWVVARVGDFNGDGHADILWQNTSTGDFSVWLMYGPTIVEATGFTGMSPWITQ
jgi:hypothetical protein